MMTRSRLLLFTRYPEAGITKTRLIARLGAAGAAGLQRKLTEHVFYEAKQLERKLNISTTVHYCGGSMDKMTSWLGPCMLVEQAEGDIGARMAAAFAQTFADGASTAILIGSDIPDISAKLLERAFRALSCGNVVVGPSHDGGYYLIGFGAAEAPVLLPLLFEKMCWSAGDLFATTMNRLAESGFTTATLPRLRDIDRPEDLQHARTRGFL